MFSAPQQVKLKVGYIIVTFNFQTLTEKRITISRDFISS